MRILVMAAGAVGGYFGSLLSDKNEVTFIARGEHLRKINRDGLQVKSITSGHFTPKATFVNSPPSDYTADVALFCVKSYHNIQAVKTISPMITDDTIILTLQNGLDSGKILQSHFPRSATILGAAYVEAEKTAAGIIQEYGGDCMIKFGTDTGGKKIQDAEDAISNLLTNSGIGNQNSPSIMIDIWKKLIFISALSGMTCLSRSNFSSIMNNPETRILTTRLLTEGFDVARSSGINLEESTVTDIMTGFELQKDQLVSSMHQDLLSGKPLEVESINGAISRAGQQFGVDTPINDTIRHCLSIYNDQIRSKLSEFK